MDLLRGRRFHVASYGVAAAYTGWLLRQYGASITHETALDPEALGAFLGEGATFTPAPEIRSGNESLLITDVPVTQEARERMATLAQSGPVLWVTPFGSEGEWSERPWSDLTLHAAGGWMSAVGDPDGEPLGPPGAQGQFTAGLFAAIAAVGGPDQRHSRGLIEVPLIEAVVATLIYDPVAFQYFGLIRARAGNRFSLAQPTLATLACKDGYIGLHSALHGQWISLCRLIGHLELVHDRRFAMPLDRAANVAQLDEYLLPWFAARTRWEAYHTLQAHRIPSSAHPDMSEVLASPQLAARDAWHDATTQAGKHLRLPGPPARVLATGDGARPERGDGPWEAGKLRVVDLSMGWAGPMVGYILGAFGADVIKVESHVHFDWWRGSRPPGDDPGLALFERSHVFNAINRGKRGITINLTAPAGRELAFKLIDGADVVIENYGAGVLERMGLTWDAISKRNGKVVMLRLPGFGGTGPESGYLSFGNTIEGMSGLTSLMGYADGPPTMMSNALGDPISGLNGTLAVLAALAAREQDGSGRLLECSQLEGFLPLVSEGLIEYQRAGNVPARHGNARPGSLASGAFACIDGEWVAIDVGTAAQWQALASSAGLDSPPNAESLAVWCVNQPRDSAVEACLAAGIAAAPVHNEAEVLGLEPLMDPAFWQGHERAYVGYYQYPGLPIRIQGARPEPSLPAPTLGEHTIAVLSALGLPQAGMERLNAEGVIGTVPPG